MKNLFRVIYVTATSIVCCIWMSLVFVCKNKEWGRLVLLIEIFVLIFIVLIISIMK